MKKHQLKKKDAHVAHSKMCFSI